MPAVEHANLHHVEPGQACPNCGHGDPLRVPDGEEDGMQIQLGDAFFYEAGPCPECGEQLMLDMK